MREKFYYFETINKSHLFQSERYEIRERCEAAAKKYVTDNNEPVRLVTTEGARTYVYGQIM